MWQIIAWPFGKLMWLCWLVLKNYGIALFVFTLLIKLILLPSSIKQQKSMARTAKINPELERIRKKYANNKEKLNEATMELYNRENINPMGSCLPMVLTFLILFAIIEVVYAPLTYISNIDSAKIEESVNTINNAYTASLALKEDGKTVNSVLAEGTNLYDQLMSYEKVSALGESVVTEISQTLEGNPGLDEYLTDKTKVSDKLVGQKASRAQLIVLSVAKDYPDIFDTDVSHFCANFDYTFLGAYLGDYPSWNSWLILIPIMSLLSQLAVTIVSQYFNKKNGMANNANKGMNTMLYVMPLFSFWIAFSFPAGLGIYWIFSAILSLAQTIFLNLYMTPARVDKMLEKENKKKNRKPSIYQMALEQQKAQLAATNGGAIPEKTALDEVTEDMKLSRAERKELERLRLNEARRAMEERYGKISEDEETKVAPEEENEILEAARRRMAEKYGD